MAGHDGSRDGCITAGAFDSLRIESGRLRRGIGLVDYSHYGKFRLDGPTALDLLNRVNLADISRLAINKMTSSLMLKGDGSVLCDAYVVNQGANYLLLTEGVAPAAVGAVLEQEGQEVGGSVQVTDRTRDLALVGLDGPYAWELLKDLIGVRILGTRYLEVVEDQAIDQIPLSILRAGKTGEFGYLLLVDAGNARGLWERLLAAGRDYEVQPCGYEAIELCKIENRFVNMHREGALAANALELNCRVMVDREKDDYVGREATVAAMQSGPRRRLIGLALTSEEGAEVPALTPGAEVPALTPGAEVFSQGKCIGTLANAAYSFGLSQHIGLGFLDAGYAYVGLDYEVQTQGMTWPVRTVSAPFILNKSLSVRPQEDSYLIATV
jgi:aminomethyltransferase